MNVVGRFLGLGAADTMHLNFEYYMKKGSKNMAVITPVGFMKTTSIMNFEDSTMVSLFDMVMDGDTSRTGMCTKIDPSQKISSTFAFNELLDTSLYYQLKPTQEKSIIMGYECQKYAAENKTGKMEVWATTSADLPEKINLIETKLNAISGTALRFVYAAKNEKKLLDFQIEDITIEKSVISTIGYTF